MTIRRLKRRMRRRRGREGYRIEREEVEAIKLRSWGHSLEVPGGPRWKERAQQDKN